MRLLSPYLLTLALFTSLSVHGSTNLSSNTMNKINRSLNYSYEECFDNCDLLASEMRNHKKIIFERKESVCQQYKDGYYVSDYKCKSLTFCLTGGKNSNGYSCLLKTEEVYNIEKKGKPKIMSSRWGLFNPVTFLYYRNEFPNFKHLSINQKKGKFHPRTQINLSNKAVVLLNKESSYEIELSIKVNSENVNVNYKDMYRECIDTREDWTGHEYCRKLGSLKTNDKDDCSFNK